MMQPLDLYAKCSQFHKLAISLAENRDPVLKQISELKSYDDRKDLAEEHWELLGEGSARAVYRINKELVIKIAINDKGEAQNAVEMKVDLQKPCSNPVIAADAKGKWLITYYTDSITKEEFKDAIGFSFDTFMKALFYVFNNESDSKKAPQDYDEIRKCSMFQCVASMVIDGALLLGDVDKPSSWGKREGKIVIRDYGFNKPVFEANYKTDTSSSSSTTKTSS